MGWDTAYVGSTREDKTNVASPINRPQYGVGWKSNEVQIPGTKNALYKAFLDSLVLDQQEGTCD